MPCVACHRVGTVSNPIDPSHIRTRGSGGPDKPFNVWPKCRECHILWGKSWTKFLEKHPDLYRRLRGAGWVIVEDFGRVKLWHPELAVQL